MVFGYSKFTSKLYKNSIPEGQKLKTFRDLMRLHFFQIVLIHIFVILLKYIYNSYFCRISFFVFTNPSALSR